MQTGQFVGGGERFKLADAFLLFADMLLRARRIGDHAIDQLPMLCRSLTPDACFQRHRQIFELRPDLRVNSHRESGLRGRYGCHG